MTGTPDAAVVALVGQLQEAGALEGGAVAMAKRLFMVADAAGRNADLERNLADPVIQEDALLTKAVPGSDEELADILAKVDAGNGANGAARGVHLRGEFQRLLSLFGGEDTIGEAQEMVKAWQERGDPLQKAFASHLMARARGVVRATQDAGEAVGRAMGEGYAASRRGRKKIGAQASQAADRAEAAYRAKVTPRRAEPGFADDPNRRAAARDFAAEDAATIRAGASRSDYSAAARRQGLRDKAIADERRAASRQTESRLTEQYRVKGGKIGRRVAVPIVAASATAYAADVGDGLARDARAVRQIAGKARQAWDESKRRRDQSGKFANT